MFTKNYYKALAKCIVYGYGTINYKSMTGETFNVAGMIDYIQFPYNSPSSSPAMCTMKSLQTTLGSYGGVILGTGETEPTIDDYSLSGDLISNYSYTSELNTVVDDTGFTTTATYTITNTGSEAITIKEIGLMSGMAGASYSSKKHKALLERTVLKTPVTIGAGGVGQVTYTIRMNYPTA